MTCIDRNMLNELYCHMEWADAAVWTSVLACESGRTDAKLRDTFHHLHVVQRAFLRMWRSEPRETPYPTFSDAYSLMLWGRSYYDEALACLGTFGDVMMSQPMALPWADMVKQRLGRSPDPTSVGDTALQVVLHSMHHRGQITARLREVGGEPPLVDYIAWLWLGKPAAVWPPPAAPEASAVDRVPA